MKLACCTYGGMFTRLNNFTYFNCSQFHMGRGGAVGSGCVGNKMGIYLECTHTACRLNLYWKRSLLVGEKGKRNQIATPTQV